MREYEFVSPASSYPMVNFVLDGKNFRSGSCEPGLYIVSTPIGNLSDISIRALKTLAGSDIIACEDTRNSGKLLKHFAIDTPMISYHEHNADRAGPKLVSILQGNGSVTLVSDAGTPLISDPGYRLVAKARQENIPVIPVPGASAPLAGLVASGLQTDSFLFAGFLPSRKVARQKRLAELKDIPATLILFESPNRLQASIADMISIFGGERNGAICRELTKLHEEILDGSLLELAAAYESRNIRGEIVIVIGAPEKQDIIDIDNLLRELLETMTVSRAAAEAAKLTGKTKRELYQRSLQMNEKPNG
ncbi:MAG: 16S rRNA (cytidine(1402)-2'-O)-methyltransferase [Hyphomicrobiales bacterium]|nr:16S rRNA (cytidine(1402)-2'-O)-methyltransferase [Hyphomicrobiales bacterium]